MQARARLEALRLTFTPSSVLAGGTSMRQAIYVAAALWCGVAQAGLIYSGQQREVITQSSFVGAVPPNKTDVAISHDLAPFAKSANATAFQDAGHYAIASGSQTSVIGDSILVSGDARAMVAGSNASVNVRSDCDVFHHQYRNRRYAVVGRHLFADAGVHNPAGSSASRCLYSPGPYRRV
jgi:hypothetical protein